MIRVMLCVCLSLTACQSAPAPAPPAAALPEAPADEGAQIDGTLFGVELGAWEASAPAPAAATLHVEELGGGDQPASRLVVLIHGGPGLSHEYMLVLGRRVADPTTRVILYDQRGAGRSPAVPPEAQTLGGQLADLESLRQRFNAKTMVLVGHSWGGLVAMAYAAAHAERVSDLILVDTLPPTAEGNVAAQRRFAARIEALTQAGVLPAEVDAAVVEPCARHILEIMPAYFHDVNHPDTKHLGGSSCDSEILRATWRNLGMFDLREALKGVRARTWIVAGASDPFGWEASEETAAALGHVTPVTRKLEACGHIPWEECPQAFYPVLGEALGLASPSW